MELEKKCPNCGKELPEEASFCLYCFTDIDNYKKSEVRPVAVVSTKNSAKKATVFCAFKSKFNKKLFCRIGLVAAFLLIMGICIFAMKSMNSGDNLKPENDTTIIKETSTVAVTDKGGEAVTDEAGEQVFDVVEVTKIAPVSTTEKQGFFDKIFNNSTTKKDDKNDKNNNSDSTETTKKQSFLDKLFGNDEEEEKTTENSSTTQKNDFSTEEHGTTQSSSTSEEITTTKPTTTKPTQTETQTSEVYETESGSYYFEYEAHWPSQPDGNIKLTKYVGNASIVTIPCYVDGRKVSAIFTDCFINDSKIKEIHFDDTITYTISTYSHSFNNLSSLTKIVTNNKGVHMDGYFAYKCPITYIGKDGTTNNKLVDGAYYKGSTFYWFTAHPSYTTLTLPDWCTKIDNGNNLDEVSNLKVINIHKNVTNVPYMCLDYNSGLKEINVESGNPMCFSQDGVLFYSSEAGSKYCVYPNSKTDKVFKIPSGKNCKFGFGVGGDYSQKVTNYALEELWLPADAVLSAPSSKQFFDNYPNLKKIYITENHPQYDNIKNGNFNGELIVTDF